VVAAGRAAGLDRLDVQVLLAHHLGRPRAWLLAHDDAVLSETQAQALQHALQSRADGVPLAYLTGWREFHGLRLQVSADVLDPRADTETLVDWALEVLVGPLADRPAPQVLDLGTGSGAIALAVAHGCRRAEVRAQVRALDASPKALAVARANGQRLGLPVQWLLGDWWAGFPPPLLDLALSNPPYIAAGDPHLPALRHEPLQALSPGGDGLAALRALVAGAPQHLRAGGWLLLEHGHDQGSAVRSLLQAAGFKAVATRRDLAGHERCSGGCWAG
jgi:release factor glutamine methyltransferase